VAVDSIIATKEFDGTVSKRFFASMLVAAIVTTFFFSGIIFRFIAVESSKEQEAEATNEWRKQHEKESRATHEALLREFELELNNVKTETEQKLATQKAIFEKELQRITDQINYDRERVDRVCENKTELLNYRVTVLEKK